jgi:ABC-type uncharacterized transport system substrate-binding protein
MVNAGRIGRRKAIGLLVAMMFISVRTPATSTNSDSAAAAPKLPSGSQIKKVFFLQSYHAEYAWSAGIADGLLSVLKPRTDVSLQMHWMDTQRNKSESLKKQAGERAFAAINEWQPDLVITSDDDAIKYVVEPFLNGTDLPVVFCGVNWNLDRYALATNQNVTGIIEIAHYQQLIAGLKPYTKGNRIGVIAGQNVNTDAEISALKNEFPNKQIIAYAVHSFEEWKEALEKATEEVDLLLVDNNAGIPDWNPEEAERLMHNAVSIPSGSPNEWMADYCMVTFAKNANEQGEWVAHAALEILEGRSPSSIPVATGKKARIFLNMGIAKKLGIRFPMELIENAHLIPAVAEPLTIGNNESISGEE